MSEVDFPAVTLCRPITADPGEYIRAVFNNLRYENPVLLTFLPNHFNLGYMLQGFAEKWVRYVGHPAMPHCARNFFF